MVAGTPHLTHAAFAEFAGELVVAQSCAVHGGNTLCLKRPKLGLTYHGYVRIGLLSDTHGALDDAVLEHFAECDEVWHAGDLGSIEVLESLKAFRTTRAVY